MVSVPPPAPPVCTTMCETRISALTTTRSDDFTRPFGQHPGQGQFTPEASTTFTSRRRIPGWRGTRRTAYRPVTGG